MKIAHYKLAATPYSTFTNYYVPPHDQVEESLNKIVDDKCHLPKIPSIPSLSAIRRKWQRKLENRNTKKVHPTAEISEKELHQGVLNGTIPSSIANSGAASNAWRSDDPSLETGQASMKIFSTPIEGIAPATKANKMHPKVREPARTVDIVPSITGDSLLSTSKFADAKYITIFDEEEVNIYDATNTSVTISRGAILRGWRDPQSGMWRIPIAKTIENINTDTVLVKKPPSELLSNRPPPSEAIHNVYELKKQPEIV